MKRMRLMVLAAALLMVMLYACTQGEQATSSSEETKTVGESTTKTESRTDNTSLSNLTESKNGRTVVFKSIDDIPPIVLEGNPIQFMVAGVLSGYNEGIAFRQAIVKSWDQLLSLYEENVYYRNEQSEKIYLFKEVKDKYDKDFFSENALILLYSPVNSTSFRHRFDSVVKKDGRIYVGVLQWIPGAGDNSVGITAAMSNWSFIVEVKKSDVIGIKNIEIIIRNKTHIK
ncbi:MAG: hypothetical protein PHH84_05540 [Oscillospiraceae bacterium]|nr:hypothetical protein [Oscillospiraceae bacterium]MDD4414320.1 hypothetical protein [Oscillospiraceae bacterium]